MRKPKTLEAAWSKADDRIVHAYRDLQAAWHTPNIPANGDSESFRSCYLQSCRDRLEEAILAVDFALEFARAADKESKL